MPHAGVTLRVTGPPNSMAARGVRPPLRTPGRPRRPETYKKASMRMPHDAKQHRVAAAIYANAKIRGRRVPVMLPIVLRAAGRGGFLGSRRVGRVAAASASMPGNGAAASGSVPPPNNMRRHTACEGRTVPRHVTCKQPAHPCLLPSSPPQQAALCTMGSITGTRRPGKPVRAPVRPTRSTACPHPVPYMPAHRALLVHPGVCWEAPAGPAC